MILPVLRIEGNLPVQKDRFIKKTNGLQTTGKIFLIKNAGTLSVREENLFLSLLFKRYIHSWSEKG